MVELFTVACFGPSPASSQAGPPRRRGRSSPRWQTLCGRHGRTLTPSDLTPLRDYSLFRGLDPFAVHGFERALARPSLSRSPPSVGSAWDRTAGLLPETGDYSAEPPSHWTSPSRGNPALRGSDLTGDELRPLSLVGGQVYRVSDPRTMMSPWRTSRLRQPQAFTSPPPRPGERKR